MGLLGGGVAVAATRGDDLAEAADYTMYYPNASGGMNALVGGADPAETAAYDRWDAMRRDANEAQDWAQRREFCMRGGHIRVETNKSWSPAYKAIATTRRARENYLANRTFLQKLEDEIIGPFRGRQ